ncbi:hypothetical protein Moror_15881, partial [Moniliophthora roreri MCA 2997]
MNDSSVWNAHARNPGEDQAVKVNIDKHSKKIQDGWVFFCGEEHQVGYLGPKAKNKELALHINISSIWPSMT